MYVNDNILLVNCYMFIIVFHINLHENCYSYDLYNALACFD